MSDSSTATMKKCSEYDTNLAIPIDKMENVIKTET